MKKGIVALLVVLALIVIISPAIVGRLAERSMDENIDFAAQESQELTVTSQGFDRGWFSSEGRHRIEVRDGQLRDLLLALAGTDDIGELPTLVINTRLDHGLIPISSMTRDGGTLKPGLGNAVSTLGIETVEGETIDVPGVIHSEVGLTGELQSNYVLEPGKSDMDGTVAQWGAVNIDVTTSPANSNVSFDGVIESLSISAANQFVRVDSLEFSGEQRQSRFGFAVGNINFTLESISMQNLDGNSSKFGPVAIDGTSSLDGNRVNGTTRLRVDGTPSTQIGDIGIVADIRLTNIDGAALGELKRKLEYISLLDGTDELLANAEKDLQTLLASGFELHVDQLNISLPQGPITLKLNIEIDETAPDKFTWTSLLLALNASTDLRVPAELVDLAITMNPEAGVAIAMGFLKKKGDFYEMEAAYRKGLLTINGAPMPIPLPAMH